jgi:hypothetical protein
MVVSLLFVPSGRYRKEIVPSVDGDEAEILLTRRQGNALAFV